MLSYPEDQNVFSLQDVTTQIAPVPNLERRTASAGIDEEVKEQMKKLKNLSISSLNLVNNKLLQMSIKGLSDSDQFEQFMLEDFKKYDSKSMYKSVAVVDTEEERKSSDKSDTE